MKITIQNFTDHWAPDFASLNYEWIEKYFSVERHDREILDDPRTHVIEPCGRIFMAITDGSEDHPGKAVGTVALIPAGQGILELTKMAVSPEFQGHGIAKLLMEACIDHASHSGAKTIFLESHRSLQPALALYTKYGFRETPSDSNSEYARADIRMERKV